MQYLDLAKPVELEPSEWVLCLEVANIFRVVTKIFLLRIFRKIAKLELFLVGLDYLNLVSVMKTTENRAM